MDSGKQIFAEDRECPYVLLPGLMVTMFFDQEAYTHVISGLDYPEDWYLSLPENQNLLKHSERGDYDFKAENNGTDPQLELPRLHRNAPAHPYQGTADSNAAHGITWSKEGMSHSFYYLCPRLISSMQISLNFLGELRHLKTEHLFAHAIPKKKRGG